MLETHYSSLIGLALLAIGALLCIVHSCPHGEQLGQQLLACGLLALNLRALSLKPG